MAIGTGSEEGGRRREDEKRNDGMMERWKNGNKEFRIKNKKKECIKALNI
jgi:hypothetical protein